MRVVLVMAAMALVAGCGGASADDAGTPGPTSGSATLAGLCPQVHLAIDDLVVSNPTVQKAFVAELERISAAGTGEAQAAIAPLLTAGRALEDAGTGPGYNTALRGIYPAQVAVNAECVKAGSPILHDGH